jgi:hypothetical protein
MLADDIAKPCIEEYFQRSMRRFPAAQQTGKERHYCVLTFAH